MRGLHEAFRIRAFTVNRATEGIAHTILAPDDNGQPLEFWYRTDCSSRGGTDLTDHAGRKLFHTLGFVTKQAISDEATVAHILALSVTELSSRLTSFLSENEWPGGPEVSKGRTYLWVEEDVA